MPGRGWWLVVTGLMVCLVAACGSGSDDADRADTRVESTAVAVSSTSPPSEVAESTTTQAPTTSSATTEIPGGDGECRVGVVRASGPISTGELVSVFETPDGQWFCVTTDRFPQAMPISIGEPTPRDRPVVNNSGTSMVRGMYHVVDLPSGTPAVTVADENDAPMFSAQSGDGRHLLIFDTDVSDKGAPGSTWVTRRWTLRDATGATVASFELRSPPPGSAPTDPRDVVTCLRAAGVDVADPVEIGLDGAPVTTVANAHAAQPFPVEVATAGWAACRAVQEEAMRDMSVSETDITMWMQFYDCMAGRGWIAAFPNEIVDQRAHAADEAECRGRPPVT